MNLDAMFGPWLPDQPTLNNPGSTQAKNCVPHDTGFVPFYDLATTSTALTGDARGAFTTADVSGTPQLFAGDATKLYWQNATDVWTDKTGASGPYTLTDTDYWRFVKWGEKVIATSYSDAPQIADFNGGTFADLGGSPPKARHIAVVRSFIVLGNLDEGGTKTGNKIFWSGQNNETAWGSSLATGSDYQILEGDGGNVQAILGGSVGVVVQERSVVELAYIGPPLQFQINEMAAGIGTPAPRSCVRFGQVVWFLGWDGIYQYEVGGGVKKIGDGKVDRWLNARINKEAYFKVTSAVDVPRAKVIWSYCTSGQTTPNEILIYDWTTGNFSYCEIANELVFTGRSNGYTMEELDSLYSSVDDIPFSLDADIWKQGAIQLSGFKTDHKSGTFEGAALTAQIDTTEVSTPDTRMLLMTNARPLVDGASATTTLRVGTRNRLNAAPSYGSTISANSIGEFNTRVSGRYARFRVDISGGFDHAIGVKVAAQPNGVR